MVPARANAYTRQYCGLTLSSSFQYICKSNFNPNTFLTYTNGRYSGGGTTTVVTSMAYRGGQLRSGVEAGGPNFASMCWKTRDDTQGQVRQVSSNGASHTILGNVDDSLNHTGCA